MASVTIDTHVLEKECAALPCTVPAEVLPALASYLELLTKWNKVMNLVGTRHWRETLRVLLVDSFPLADFLKKLALPAEPQTWDLGAGAGLPGIPLRMIWQCGQYHLVEAREKRALFLSTVLARIPLPRTTVFRGRAEDFFHTVSAPADVIVSRAFLPWLQMLNLVKEQLAPGGRVVFLALEPPPIALPAGWCVEAAEIYTAAKNTRHFWCLRTLCTQ